MNNPFGAVQRRTLKVPCTQSILRVAILITSIIASTSFSQGDPDTGDVDPPSIRLTISEPFVPVMDWFGSQCNDTDVSDQGLRLFRDFNGDIDAFADNEADNFPLRGHDVFRLKKICRSAYQSQHDGDPAKFDDETWLASTWTDDGQHVLSIAHHEYHGDKHPGRCLIESPRDCRYGALLPLISDDGGATFKKGSPKPVAAVPQRQSSDQTRDTGFVQPSNIFQWGKWKYVFMRSAGGGAQPPATCLMRAEDALNISSWTMFTGTAFEPALFDPYTDDSDSRVPCVGIHNLNGGLVWSVVAYKPKGLLLALMSVIETGTMRSKLVTSTSYDAIHWSKPVDIVGVPLEWGARRPKEPYLQYPALIDPSSQKRNFDDVGSSAFLFMTRIHLRNGIFSMQRELVFAPAKLDVL